MCWSGEASFALATVGFATTALAAKNGEKKELFLPLFWFSLMELLQGFTYIWIDLCDNPTNQLLTLLGYLHIAFQPFFANMVYMYFMPQDVTKRIAPWVYSACFVVSIMMIIDIYPFSWAEPTQHHFMRSENLCSVSGDWHIAWEIPVFNTTIEYTFINQPYMWVVFVLPFLYGSWKMTTYHLFTGLFLSIALTNDFNETAAVWCLLSIGLLTIVVKTKVRNYLYVNTWYGLQFPKFMREAQE
jgi:hypothetical protein